MTTLQWAEQIARWLQLHAEKERADKLAQVEPVYAKGGRGHQGGINEAVRDLGIERNEAQRAVKIASLSEQAKQAAREVGVALSAFRQSPARQWLPPDPCRVS